MSVDYGDIDPGIRGVAKALNEAGFETTDSGDGRSKFLDPKWDATRCPTMACPHVILKQSADFAEAGEVADNVVEWADSGAGVAAIGGLALEVTIMGSESEGGPCFVALMGPETEFAEVAEAALDEYMKRNEVG